MHRFAKRGLAALSLFVAAPLVAQDDANAHQRLVDAIADPVRLMAKVDEAIDAEQRFQFEQDSEMQAIEAECSGSYALMVATIRPFAHELQARAIDEYRASLLELFTARLEADEARGAAEFYESDLGQALVRAADDNLVETRMVSEMRREETVSREAFEADKQATKRAIIQRVDPAVLSQAAERLLNSPWFPDFRSIEPDIKRLQLAMVNTDFNADEQQRFDAALEDALIPHYEACPIPEE